VTAPIRALSEAAHALSRGDFDAAGVAHEIRTPLTSLKLYLQSVQDEAAPTREQAEDLDVAMRQVRRIETTINHFLDFARPREPSMSQLDFAGLVDDALVVVEPRARQQEVEVERSIAARLPSVEGDARQLGEALVNLLVNALEAMPEGGRLAIAVARDAEEPGAADRPWTRIDVTDTGPGIRTADLDRLFEPFFTTKASGSGLGLAIVQGVVERHGGRVKVHTTPGAGTTFSIYLRGSLNLEP
jgi:signal transduction histidine kinase